MESIKTKISGGDTVSSGNGGWKSILIRILVGGSIAFVLFIAGIIYDLTVPTRHNYETGYLKTAKISRSKSACTQTEILNANIKLDGKSVILVNGCAIGKFNNTSCPKIEEGMVDIRILVDDIEIAQNTVHSNGTSFRLDERTISSTLTAFVEKDEGMYPIRVIAVYYGNIELHYSNSKYMVIPKSHTGILKELTTR